MRACGLEIVCLRGADVGDEPNVWAVGEDTGFPGGGPSRSRPDHGDMGGRRRRRPSPAARAGVRDPYGDVVAEGAAVRLISCSVLVADDASAAPGCARDGRRHLRRSPRRRLQTLPTHREGASLIRWQTVPCPRCGRLTLPAWPGDHGVPGLRGDAVLTRLRWPLRAGGAPRRGTFRPCRGPCAGNGRVLIPGSGAPWPA